MPKPSSKKMEIELSAEIFTDVIADVIMSQNIEASSGIMGTRPVDRLARPGKMVFNLNNSEGNSAAKLGYYSPVHANALSGFELGAVVRLMVAYGGTEYYKFYGKITEIQPVLGQKRQRQTRVTVMDFLEDMRNHKLDMLTVKENRRSDLLFADLIDNMPVKPAATSYSVGQETFAYAGDDLKDEKTTAMAAAYKIAMSEFGYGYIKGGVRTPTTATALNAAASSVYDGIHNFVGLDGIGGGWYDLDSPGSYTDIYSASLNTNLDMKQFGMYIRARVNAAGIWADSTIRYMMQIKTDGNNLAYIARTPNDNEFEFRYIAGGTSETVTKSAYSETGWYGVGITVDTAAGGTGEMKAFLDGNIVGVAQETLGAYAGALSITDCCLGASDTGATTPWSGWLLDAVITINGVVPTEINISDLDAALTAQTLTTIQLDQWFGADNWIWYELRETNAGTLVYEDRHTRVKTTTVTADINDTMIEMEAKREVKNIYNRIRAIAYPRDVGGSVETLFTLQRTLEIAAGGTETFIARYVDPDSKSTRISGMDMQDPEGDNQITNRTFEADATNWTAAAGASFAQSVTRSRKGDYSGLLTTGVGTADKYYVTSNKMTGVSSGDVVYAQAYVYVPDAWPDDVELYAQELDAGDVVLVGAVVEETGALAQWVRLSGNYTTTDTACAKVELLVGQASGNKDFSGGAVTLYLDECYLIDDALLNFEFSTSTAGGGDANDDLVMYQSTMGANSAEYILTNEGSAVGYVTGITPKGTAIRRYESATAVAEDRASQLLYGVREMVLILNYQDSVLAAQDWADITLAGWKDPQDLVRSITIHGNRDATTLTDVLEIEPGARVEFTEVVSGLADDEFFVNGVQFSLGSGDEVKATWTVIPAAVVNYWVIGIDLLGIASYLGF